MHRFYIKTNHQYKESHTRLWICFFVLKNISISCDGKSETQSCSKLWRQQGENRQEAFLLSKRYLVWLLTHWLKYRQPLQCITKNKDAFWMRANMFLFVRLFPWRLCSGIIVFRPQTETDQTHRQPTDQDRSCGSGTHHALIRFGLVSVWCVQTKAITPVSLCPCQVVCQNRERFGKES